MVLQLAVLAVLFIIVKPHSKTTDISSVPRMPPRTWSVWSSAVVLLSLQTTTHTLIPVIKRLNTFTMNRDRLGSSSRNAYSMPRWPTLMMPWLKRSILQKSLMKIRRWGSLMLAVHRQVEGRNTYGLSLVGGEHTMNRLLSHLVG